MVSVAQQLNIINEKVHKAVLSVEDDIGASDELLAIMQDFYNKSQRAVEATRKAGRGEILHDQVIELEQAADGAKIVAKADKGINESTRKLIIEAHHSASNLKSGS